MNISLKNMTIGLSEKTILICGDYSRVFPFIVNLIEINSKNTLLLLDDFNMRTLLNEASSFDLSKLSTMTVSKFESLVELDRILEHSETLLNKGMFSLLVLGSLSNAYLREISLHEPNSHSNILYLLNKILAFFSFLSKKYGCTGILIGPSGDLNGEANIPAKRIFLYWVDYLLELRRCNMSGVIGELTAKNGEKTRLCIPLKRIREIGEVGECNRDACPRNV
ncbi:MAG: hypothetical protein QW385_02445 [Thermoproteota archaeon]